MKLPTKLWALAIAIAAMFVGCTSPKERPKMAESNLHRNPAVCGTDYNLTSTKFINNKSQEIVAAEINSSSREHFFLDDAGRSQDNQLRREVKQTCASS